jgi:hypothetical protein
LGRIYAADARITNKYRGIRSFAAEKVTMQHLIEEVTRRLVSRLPESKAYYSLSDLHDFQIPGFIISRIELELRRNLADSVVPPNTDWANMSSQSVKVSWDNFLKAIHEQVRLPRSFSRTVLEVAVSDVLELLIQPRKNMVELIFGTEQNLKFEELRQAASHVTVYPYLPDALIKYMHRKQLASISKEKAKEILTLVDEKLTAKYTPLNWAQLMDPLFALLGEEIETELFRQFFSDRGKQRWADFFDLEKEDINRTRFIEILSLPELDGIEEYNPSDEPIQKTNYSAYQSETVIETQIEQFRNEGFENEINLTAENESVEFMTQVERTSDVMDSNQENDNTPAEEVEVSIGKVRAWGLDEEISENNTDSSDSLTDSEDHHEDVVIDLDAFETEQKELLHDSIITQNQDLFDDRRSTIAFDENPQSDRMEHSINESEDEDDQPIYKKVQSFSTNEEKPLAERIQAQEDIPFWKRFVSHEEDNAHLVYDEEAEHDSSKLDELTQTMFDLESEFVQELFGGDQNAYVQALDDISAFEYWEDVSRYVKDEIIRVGMIDPLSDTCIEFVDRLQTYFTSNHS